MEQPGYNLLLRCFTSLSSDDPGVGSRGFLEEPFSVDGTLLQALTSQKSFRPKDDSFDDQPPNPRMPLPEAKTNSAGPRTPGEAAP